MRAERETETDKQRRSAIPEHAGVTVLTHSFDDPHQQSRSGALAGPSGLGGRRTAVSGRTCGAGGSGSELAQDRGQGALGKGLGLWPRGIRVGKTKKSPFQGQQFSSEGGCRGRQFQCLP